MADRGEYRGGSRGAGWIRRVWRQAVACGVLVALAAALEPAAPGGSAGAERRVSLGAAGFGPATLASAAIPAPADDVRRAARAGGEMLSGPVAAELIKVVDGDTLRVRARIWLGQEILVSVRLRGIDAPELRGRCGDEMQLARKARALVARETGAGGLVLSDISGGKYHGRVIARVRTAQGRDLAPLLLEAGLARPYDGGRRAGWCGSAALGRP